MTQSATHPHAGRTGRSHVGQLAIGLLRRLTSPPERQIGSKPVALYLATVALRLAGAGLLIWVAAIHLDLWSQGYRQLPTNGPLFLADAIGGFALAAVLVVWPRSGRTARDGLHGLDSWGTDYQHQCGALRVSGISRRILRHGSHRARVNRRTRASHLDDHRPESSVTRKLTISPDARRRGPSSLACLRPRSAGPPPLARRTCRLARGGVRQRGARRPEAAAPTRGTRLDRMDQAETHRPPHGSSQRAPDCRLGEPADRRAALLDAVLYVYADGGARVRGPLLKAFGVVCAILGP